MNLTPTITAKYTAHLRTLAGADGRIHVDAAILALLVSMSDLDECWLDEYGALQQRLQVAQQSVLVAEQLVALLRDERDNDQALISNLQSLLDQKEEECNRLRQISTPPSSSSHSPVGTAQSAPAAPATSKRRRLPSPPSPTESSANDRANAASASPASGVGATGESEPPNFPLPAWWPEAVATMPTVGQSIASLDRGEIIFRHLATAQRMAITAEIYRRCFDGQRWVSMQEFRNAAPNWMSTPSALVNPVPTRRWNVLLHLLQRLASTVAPNTGGSSPTPPSASE